MIFLLTVSMIPLEFLEHYISIDFDMSVSAVAFLSRCTILSFSNLEAVLETEAVAAVDCCDSVKERAQIIDVCSLSECFTAMSGVLGIYNI